MKKKKSEIELICIEKILNYKQTITLGPNLISSINPNFYNLIASVLPLQFRPCVGLNFGFDFRFCEVSIMIMHNKLTTIYGFSGCGWNGKLK